MERVDFFERQDGLRRLTVVLLVITAIGAIGTASMGGLATAIAHIQFERDSYGTLDMNQLRGAFVIGASVSLGLGSVIVLLQLILLRFSRRAALRFFRARDLSSPDEEARLTPSEQQLVNVVAEMSIASGLSPPRVYVLDDDPTVNSFALVQGRRPIIGVCAGTFDRLTRVELQAVIAHELAHIANGDAAINIRLLALVRGFRWFYDFGVAVIGWPVRAFGANKVSIMFLFYLAIPFCIFVVLGSFGVGVARVMQACIARQREYLADASAVQFTRATAGLSAALSKAGRIRPSSKKRPTHVAAFMMFVSPYRARSWLFRTHPSIESRIEAVAAMTPGSVHSE